MAGNCNCSRSSSRWGNAWHPVSSRWFGVGLEWEWDKLALTWALVLPPVDGLEAGAEGTVWTCDSGLAGRRLARSASVSGGESSPLLLSLSPFSTPSIELAPSIAIPRTPLPRARHPSPRSTSRPPPNQPSLARVRGGTYSSARSHAVWWNNRLSRTPHQLPLPAPLPKRCGVMGRCIPGTYPGTR
jgi:hypothetical protein